MHPVSDSESNQLTELPEQSARIEDNILTEVERKERYRAKLVRHQEGRGMRLKRFALGKRQYFRSLDLYARRKRAEDIDLTCRYFNGDQYGSYDAVGVYSDRRQEGDYAYAIPIMSGHVEQAFLQLLKVKPAYTVTPDEKDDPTMKLVASMCEDLGVKELQRVMDKVAHSELYNMILGGENYRFLGWEPNRVSPRTVKRPNYAEEEFPIPARRACAEPNCNATVGPDAMECQDCGSKMITDIPASIGRRQKLTGMNDVALGENVVRVPHLLSIQRDLSAIEPDDSTFLIEYNYIDKHVAEWEFQSEIEPSNLGLPVEMLLRFDLERSSNQTDAIIGTARLASPGREGGYGGAASTAASARKQPLERHYWDVSQYGQFVCQVDETLPNGRVLEAGTVLGDAFPDGLMLLFAGDTIMQIEPYVRRRKQTLMRYGRIAGTNQGAGLKKILPLQDAENDNFNLNQTVKHTVGHPLTVIDGHYISELPSAGNVLKITRAGVDDIGKVVKQFQGQAVNNSDGAQMIIESAMQFIAGTNTVGGSGLAGAPDMRAAGTATGIAAMQEQAAGRQSHAVDQRISADKELLMQLLENIQEYSVEEQKLVLARRYGADVAAAFFNCDLRHSVTVGIKSNTDMPRSMALTQANYLAFATAASTILPVSQQHPWVMEFLADLATSMGFPFAIGEGRNDRREAEYRLNVLTEIETSLLEQEPNAATNPVQFATVMYAEIAERCKPLIGTDNPEEDPAAPSELETPRVFMQVHQSFLDVYKDALFGEKAKAWSESYKLVVIQMWLDHFKAKLSEEAVMTQLMAQVNAAMNPQPPPPTETGPTAEDIAAEKEEDHRRELELRSADHEADQISEDAKLERDLVREDAKARNAATIETVRAAVRPEPAKTNGAGKK